MTLAVRWGEEDEDGGGFIYFDAVSAYTQTYSGQVTKHPISTGGSIVDHYIKENPVFTIGAVITSVDISTGSYLIQDLTNSYPMNTRQAPNPVSVNSTDQSVLSQFIPGSLSQFLSIGDPNVVMDSPRVDLTDQVRDMLISLTSGTKFNELSAQFDSNIQLIKLYEFDQRLLKRILNNLVITSIRFSEDANSGYALYCDITFEQVTFSTLKKTTIPKRVKPAVSKKASSKKSLGKCDSTVKDSDSEDNKDPQAKKDAITDSDPLRNIGN